MTEIDTERFAKLRPLQEKHLELLNYIDKICTENNIRYSLAYGSALGAVRHGGPIPWDDDADTYMPAEDYREFKRIFNEKGDKEKFYLQELQSVDGMFNMAKLRLNGTAFLEESFRDWDIHQGIYVDIFILHDCPPTAWEKKKSILADCYRMIKEMANTDYKKRKIVRPLILLLRLFPRSFGMRAAYRQMYKWDGSNQDLFADYELYNGNPRWFIKKDIIFPAKRMSYMGCSLCVPRETERYLEICYGDWKEIPQIDDIEWAQHGSLWSTDEDFRDKLPGNVFEFKDEAL